MEHIKDHFESEAEEFDGIIIKLIPYYQQMIEALLDAIPFSKEAAIKVIDLGCGTGTISKQIAERFPNAHITCLDFAPSMIEMSKVKLANHQQADFIVSDFAQFDFKKYDVVVSSLALHHLMTDDAKKNVYKKIYKALNTEGVFFNADVVLASSNYLQKIYMQRWKEYMNRSVSMEEIESQWMKTYETEDSPAQLLNQIDWLNEIGFQSVDIIWKYYNFSVYGGYK